MGGDIINRVNILTLYRLLTLIIFKNFSYEMLRKITRHHLFSRDGSFLKHCHFLDESRDKKISRSSFYEYLL